MRRKRAAPAIQDVIAERVFERADGREVRAVVGRPRQVRNGEWVCEFRVLGVSHSKVYALSGNDSLEALQLALGTMVVQLESYQKEHGLTFMGESLLLLWRPDVEAMMREIKATADFPHLAQALDGIWKEMTGGPLRPGTSET